MVAVAVLMVVFVRPVVARGRGVDGGGSCDGGWSGAD